MAVLRDEFPKPVRELLAKRVGHRCSNPNCRKPTSGPQAESAKAVNIGVAAHISAASDGGPRYDKDLSSADRADISNGIWLCQNCAKLVDNDPNLYTSDFLRRWRRLSEEAARMAVESSGSDVGNMNNDMRLLKFYTQCFERPAFQDPFHQEGSMETFDQAIEATITALNTGCLRSNDGVVLQRARGKAYVSNPEWRETLDTIVDMLRATRSRYDAAVRRGEIYLGPESNGSRFYDIRDRQVAEWMDRTRTEILDLFSTMCRQAGLKELHFPHSTSRRRIEAAIGRPLRELHVPPPKDFPNK